jgi:hypothetical protein
MEDEKLSQLTAERNHWAREAHGLAESQKEIRALLRRAAELLRHTMGDDERWVKCDIGWTKWSMLRDEWLKDAGIGK